MGGSYYMGDLSPAGNLLLTKPGGGIEYRYTYNPRFEVRGNFFFTSVSGDDARSNSLSQKQRNLRFKSNIFELSGQLEFNFLPYSIGDPEKPSSPYIFMGLGVFSFDPLAEIDGKEYSLQPLGTEGQGTPSNPGLKKYKLVQACVPFGVGAKFSLAKRMGLTLEWGIRKTFTDYLDDVSTIYPDPVDLNGSVAISLSDRSHLNDPNISNVGRQRGNSKNKDWYTFVGIVLGFKFEKEVTCSYNY